MLFDSWLVSIFYDFVTQSQLTEFSVILLFIVAITGLLKIFKQPLIIGYIVAGIVIGPSVMNVVKHVETIDIFAHMGIGLLLFMVGLGLSPKTIKDHGKVALSVWAVQIWITALLGFWLGQVFGFDTVTSLYIAGALTFSSTIVIVKLLEDRDDMDSLYGKIAIWLLIVQDLMAMGVLIVASIASGQADGSVGLMLLKWGILLIWLFFFTRYCMPALMDRVAKSQEHLLLFGLFWCFFLGSLFDYVGFSMEIGTLLAWMSFAMSPYRIEMAQRLSSLRDFFLVLFFVVVWMQLVFGDMAGYRWFVAVWVFVVIVIKPLAVFLATKLFWFTNKTALRAGLSIGQISEFSFLLIGLGVTYGHIQDTRLLSAVMFVGLISICISTYYMLGMEWIFQLFNRFLWHGSSWVKKKMQMEHEHLGDHEVIVFGFGTMGMHLSDVFSRNKVSYAVIDHNPLVVAALKEKKTDYIFADATNVDAYRHLFDKSVKLCISTMKALEDNLTVIKMIKHDHPHVAVVVLAETTDEALHLYRQWADYVLMPHRISAYHANMMIEEMDLNVENFIEKKIQHLKELEDWEDH